MADNELGEFIRAHRDAVTPRDVGLADGGRRRAPGLRRAELATLAGISVDHLVRLEQGRERSPSTQVLIALADALLLTTDERVRLRCLTQAGDVRPPSVRAPATTVRASVASLLERLEPAPAVVLNRLGDAVSFTTGYERLVGALGVLDLEPPNVIRYVFGDDRSFDAYPEWVTVAQALISDLKVHSDRDDPYATAFVEELTAIAGTAFTDRMNAASPAPERPRTDRLVHPDVGELRLVGEVLDLTGDDDLRMVVHVPADDATSAALDRLTGLRPGALRAV